MTINALHNLLTEIDTQGGPQAARDNRLNLTTEGTPTVTTAPALRPMPPTADVQPKTTAQDPETLAVGKLLAWGDQHTDPTVQDQAALARTALHGLRQRYAADRELAAITSEREQLEQRLAELQAREAELAPPAKSRRRKGAAVRDYEPAVVREWAKANGHEVPPVGRVPRVVVEAWRAAQSAA